MSAETVTDSKRSAAETSATRNAPAELAISRPGHGWTCRCGQSGKHERHCAGCHTTGHQGCWWCGKCLPLPPRGRLQGSSYCSSSCRVYVSRWERSAAGEQWRRERDKQRAQAERERAAKTKPRDWFEDPFAAMFGGAFVYGAFPEPPDSVALRTLGLTAKPASQDAVKAAFRKRLMEVHPDLATYTDPTIRALWERMLGSELTVQELVWARDVLYKKIPPVPQPGAETIVASKPQTEEERREARRREDESKRTGLLCWKCGHEFEATETRHLYMDWNRVRLACLTCAPERRYQSPVGACETCGRPLQTGRGILRRYRLCSTRCASSFHARARRLRIAAEREPRTCLTCGERFDHGRSDIRYCSSTCRQRAYRERRA
jgi:hypothetical protein